MTKVSDLTAKQPRQELSGADLAAHLAAARAGDQEAFSRLTEPHRYELLAHCYRMLGSLQDAEDLVQETFLRAWRRLETYAERASFRAWLYKIATNACLDELHQRPKRLLPTTIYPPGDPAEPMGQPVTDPVWLEPFPDELLAPRDVSPEARYDAQESITLAFMIALQLLPPRQRAVLILRDVLDWRAEEVAGLLETTLSAVNSMLYRARSTLAEHYTSPGKSPIRAAQADSSALALLDRYVHAWETADIDALVSLLKEDATFPMPPSPSWYYGREAIRAFIAATILNGEARGRWRLLPVNANAQPSFAWYRRDESGDTYQAFAIQVLTLQGELLADVTTFGIPDLFPYFGLAPELKV